ncbi:hypothetical protein SARC_00672 [Sphaeroforma arctica JP610]|uniref:Uncharacterized protein n=1 Tax=Sphaeroforma arctica JP610 TaxID=667725 RepID=A0A0L0GDV9_9EUKA|nr:hypothetical protein SARC_00672 [Sphaeroforma arctica JP610]KNC87195.1 hypothetical protein SARC_00672 [Sphaeroforma arctica JP610]|eukprot:XP_014161097.1 hypothetical protein SARC_00672 [Sphaeroforma arctica JP610]
MRFFFYFAVAALGVAKVYATTDTYTPPEGLPLVAFSPGVNYQLMQADNDEFVMQLTIDAGSKLVTLRHKDGLSATVVEGSLQRSEDGAVVHAGDSWEGPADELHTFATSHATKIPSKVLLTVKGEVEYLVNGKVVNRDNSKTIQDKYKNGHTYLGRVDGELDVESLLNEFYSTVKTADSAQSVTEKARAARTEFIFKYLAPAVGMSEVQNVSEEEVVLLAMTGAPKELYEAFLTLPYSAETIMAAIKLEKKLDNLSEERERKAEIVGMGDVFPADVAEELERQAEEDREFAARKHQIMSEMHDGHDKELLPHEALAEADRMTNEALERNIGDIFGSGSPFQNIDTGKDGLFANLFGKGSATANSFAEKIEASLQAQYAAAEADDGKAAWDEQMRKVNEEDLNIDAEANMQ